MRELNGLMPKTGVYHADIDINWAKWKEFNVLYNIKGASMHSPVKEHVSVLKLKGNKISKNLETDSEEQQQYIFFLERKRNTKFEGLARFCMVTMGLERTMFFKWDNTISRAEMREDRRGCPFALIDFRRIPGASRQGAKGETFYNPFMAKFIEYKIASHEGV